LLVDSEGDSLQTDDAAGRGRAEEDENLEHGRSAMAVPTKDSLLAGYSTNFDVRVNATPATYGFTAAQATAYSAVHDPFIAALNAVIAADAAGTRSSALVATKNTAKRALLTVAREMYAQCQASIAVTDTAKIELGITIRNAPTPKPVPGSAPAMDIVSVAQNTVDVRLHDATDSSHRGKPVDVDGAAIFSFVGDEPPTADQGWNFEGNVTRTRVNIEFPASVAPGSKVWFTAFWFNERKEAGPLCAPISTRLQGGAAMAA
jgi:hypothetical protein